MTNDLNAYQLAAISTAVYPDRGTGSNTALAYCALGLGEVGEVQGKVKKLLRGDKPNSLETREAIMYELGDTLWYIAAMANELGYSLDAVAEANIEKLQKRKATGMIKGDGDNR